MLRLATVRVSLAAGISCFPTEINKLLTLNLTPLAAAKPLINMI